MSTNELTSKVRELKELKAMADELAAEITSIEDIIKAEMTARNTEEMLVRAAELGYKVRHTELIPPTAINSHNTINGNNNIIGNGSGNNITNRPSNQAD